MGLSPNIFPYWSFLAGGGRTHAASPGRSPSSYPFVGAENVSPAMIHFRFARLRARPEAVPLTSELRMPVSAIRANIARRARQLLSVQETQPRRPMRVPSGTSKSPSSCYRLKGCLWRTSKPSGPFSSTYILSSPFKTVCRAELGTIFQPSRSWIRRIAVTLFMADCGWGTSRPPRAGIVMCDQMRNPARR